MGNRSCRKTTVDVPTDNGPGWWPYGLRSKWTDLRDI